MTGGIPNCTRRPDAPPLMMRTSLLFLVCGLVACRGSISEQPPIHINPNMDDMERYEAQEESAFFADGRAMRAPVPGTVARGMLRDDTAFYVGRDAAGAYVTRMPLPYTKAFAERGRTRYNIFCGVCHGEAGDGQGIVMTGGYGFAPIGYHTDRLRAIEDGYLYDVIAHGIRTMPAYGPQIPVADRWAIVAYIRAMQRSQHAVEADIPRDILSTLRP